MAAKMTEIGGKNVYRLYYGCRQGVTRKGNLGHYHFHIVGLLRGQNQPVDQVTAAALLKYGQNCTSPMCDFTHFCPPSSQILSYINIICNINRKLLTQVFTWI